MDGPKSTQNSLTSSKAAVKTTTVLPDAIRRKKRTAQNFLLIWMDDNIDQSNEDYQHAVEQLQRVVNNVNIFTQRDECVDFLTEVDGNRKVYLMTAVTIGKQIVPLIHDIPQLQAVYIFCDNKSEHEQWPKKWIKIKGIHTDIESICESIQQSVKQCIQDAIVVSFIAVDEEVSNQNLNQLEPLFMYTQISKEILLEMEYNEQSITDFTTYCRNGNYGSPNIINRFENEYNAELAVWWYTFPSFIYSLLNSSLRTMNAKTIVKMGFFIHDLHHQIQELHQKQVSSYQRKPFIVYRGQGLSVTDFEKLHKTKGGLMSFDNFLYTSSDEEVSLDFAKGASRTTDTVGILFKMTIDPSVSSIPFASIDGVGYFKTEGEMLFSMHAIFRIGEIKKIGKNNQLYQVELKLTSDDDQQLGALTKRIREGAGDGTGLDRLGVLLARTGYLYKAEELYKVLLEQTSDEIEQAIYYNNLGCLKNHQNNYEKAIWYHEKALRIYQQTLPRFHPSLADAYNNIAIVYYNMEEYTKALSFYEKSLEIKEKTLPSNHPNLATSYSNIIIACYKMGEYSKALSFYEKSVEIKQKTLPRNHPLLADAYNNIAIAYYNMEEYSKALSFYEKALEIYEKTLPPNYPSLANSYNNIGGVYDDMGENSKALWFYEKALETYGKARPPNHLFLASSYNNIGLVYQNMGKYSKAVSFYEEELKIRQKYLPPNHPDLTTSCSNIAIIYYNMEEYSKALSYFERALVIKQRSLPSNHHSIQKMHEIIEFVKQKL